jgi:hypothetical protein
MQWLWPLLTLLAFAIASAIVDRYPSPLQPPAPGFAESQSNPKANSQAYGQNTYNYQRQSDVRTAIPNRDPDATITHTHPANDATPQNQEASLDRWVKIGTVLSGVFTSILAFIGIGQAWLFFWQLKLIRKGADDAKMAAEAARDSALASAEANRLNQRLFAASERPWMQVQVTVGGPLVYDPINSGMLRATFLITCKNIGKSPALKAVLEVEMLAPAIGVERNLDIPGRQRALAEQAKLRGDSRGLSQLVFPGDASLQNYTLTMPRGELDRITAKTDLLALTLIGCIDYQLLYEAGHHQTWFSYDLVKRHGDRWLLIGRSEGDMPPENLLVIPTITAEKYAD